MIKNTRNGTLKLDIKVYLSWMRYIVNVSIVYQLCLPIARRTSTMKTLLVFSTVGKRLLRFLLVLAGVIFLLGGAPAVPAQAASQFDLPGPAGSGNFGAALLATT